MNAIFNELIRIGDWDEANPFAKVKKLKLDEVELKYLSLAEITELLDILQGSTSDAYHIARICLATGARWGEGERITGEQVKPGLIRFRHTKNSKGRAAPIDAAFYESLPKARADYSATVTRPSRGLPNNTASICPRANLRTCYATPSPAIS